MPSWTRPRSAPQHWQMRCPHSALMSGYESHIVRARRGPRRGCCGMRLTRSPTIRLMCDARSDSRRSNRVGAVRVAQALGLRMPSRFRQERLHLPMIGRFRDHDGRPTRTRRVVLAARTRLRRRQTVFDRESHIGEPPAGHYRTRATVLPKLSALRLPDARALKAQVNPAAVEVRTVLRPHHKLKATRDVGHAGWRKASPAPARGHTDDSSDRSPTILTKHVVRARGGASYRLPPITRYRIIRYRDK